MDLDVADDITVGELDAVKRVTGCRILLNGVPCGHEESVADGDTVAIAPPEQKAGSEVPLN